MRGMMRMGMLVAAVSAAVGFGAIVGMAQDKEPILKERQTTMKRQEEDYKAIAGYAKGEVEQAVAIEKVNDLLAIAPKIVAFFPEGTSVTEFPGKTAAKPDIWKEWDKFKALPDVLKGEEEKLAVAIKSGDKQAVVKSLTATGRNGCGGCHTSYREKT